MLVFKSDLIDSPFRAVVFAVVLILTSVVEETV